MSSSISLLAVLLLLIAVPFAAPYRILGVFPTSSRSHHITGSALMRGLAAAGHDVTVISPFPMSKPPPRYRDIAVLGVAELMAAALPDITSLNDRSTLMLPWDMHMLGVLITNYTLSHPRFQQFLADPTEQFDLVVSEVFLNEAMLGLGWHYRAPVVAYSTFGASMYTNDLVGTPSPTSYVPHPFLKFTDRMQFWERAANLAFTVYESVCFRWHLADQQRLYEQFIPGANKPPLDELRRNVPLVLLNTHFTLGTPRPYAPNMIEVGGLHVNRKAPEPLPERIRTFVEGADEHGVIYFSLGSNVRSAGLPAAVRDGILRALGSLKQRVLWKWEDAELPGKPDNVLVSPWFPQDDVLAHPKVRLFITHGGLLSTTEAIYHGVPLVGVPVFGDQSLNMGKAEAAGYARTVHFANLTEESLRWAVNEVLGDAKYAQKAKLASQRYRDQPMTPLETGVYWVEYVARHGGAKHLHSAGQDLEWWQYHNADVYAAFVAILWLIGAIGYKAVKFLFATKSQRSTKKQKKH